MGSKEYFEFMQKITALADEYGLELANQDGNLCKDPAELDIILEFVTKGYV